jgi:hypothetical protein
MCEIARLLLSEGAIHPTDIVGVDARLYSEEQAETLMFKLVEKLAAQ